MINWLRSRFSRDTALPETEGQFSLGDTELRVIVSPEQARAELEDQLLILEYTKGSFSAKDLLIVLEKTGRSRTWLHAEIKKLLETERVYYDDSMSSGRYVFIDRDLVTESN